MQLKILSKKILLIIGTVAIVFFSIVTFSITFGSFTNSSYEIRFLPTSNWVSEKIINNKPAEFVPEGQAVWGLPIRLKIPVINVNSMVEYVGLTPDGAMDIPKSTDMVAWFKTGQRPGENGSAVVAGHYGIKDGKGSVFDNLHRLRQGDKIYIEDDKGMIISFVVRESRRYDPNADASNVFGSDDGKSHLNLITCEGDWDKALKSYSTRLVVFTDKE